MQTSNQTKTRVILLIVFALALYAVLPQIAGFQDSLAVVKSADLSWLLFSLFAIAVSYLFAGLTYYLLASPKVSYAKTVLLEIAATFINRLLPAGIGGMGVNYVYLRHNKHSQGAAASVVAINNILGFVGHAILFILVYLILNPRLPSGVQTHNYQFALVGAGLLIVGTWALLTTSSGKRFQKQVLQIKKQIGYYRKNPLQVPLALLSSMGLTICVALALYFCSEAFGLGLSFSTIFLIFSAGFAVGNATPTPGGLGGIEAGLAVGMVAYSVPRVDAIAAVLVFRLISFWIPTAVGAIAFIYVQQRKIL